MLLEIGHLFVLGMELLSQHAHWITASDVL